jgi:hypothetical protein
MSLPWKDTTLNEFDMEKTSSMKESGKRWVEAKCHHCKTSRFEIPLSYEQKSSANQETI